MNELVTRNETLPDNLEDLTQFVLVGKSKLQAYMLKLRTINRLSTAQEVRDQTLQEAQEISAALMAAEQRIGEILLEIPTATGRRTDIQTSSERVEKVKTKAETTKEMGYTKDEVYDYQRMAQNPEIVQRVIDQALSDGKIVTKSAVMREIESAQRAQKEAARLADAYKSDFERERDRVASKSREILELKNRISELEGATTEGLDTENLSQNVFYFCTMANNFIGNVGGLVWLTDRIADMPKKEREMFLKAAYSFRDWALAFASNLERSVNDEQRTGADTGISLLTD